jgi:hypothetical protein
LTGPIVSAAPRLSPLIRVIFASRAHKTVDQILMIVAGGGYVEFDGGSARYVRYGVIFDVNPAFDTRMRRRQREEI